MHSWFWREGFKTQSAEVLAGVYRDCMRRHSNLLLNLSSDKSGRLPDEAVQTMREVARIVQRTSINRP